MRERKEIEQDFKDRVKDPNVLLGEILLDIRDLLNKKDE